MSRRTAPSAQTLAVLAALVARPSEWRHGYDLARETGLQSGTLYPILVRLADREIVEARWEDGVPAGRPRRHLYRLTSGGLSAAAALAAAPPAAARPATVARPARSRGAGVPGPAGTPGRAGAPGRTARPARLAGEGS
jgi:PadR family transcriptional regulator, regulatory protein PadR